MELSLLGETIVRKSTDATKYHGFWLTRGGNEGTFAINAIYLSGTTFDVIIETKDSNTADASASTLGSAQSITTVGITKWTVAGAKEWVRYVIRPTGTGATRMHFQLLDPQWTHN